MKFRAASSSGSAVASRGTSSLSLGPAPSPFEIPSLGGGGGLAAYSSTTKSNMALSPPPSSSKKKNDKGKRSKVRSPLVRSPLGFHRLNNSSVAGNDGDGASMSMSEASGSLSSAGGNGAGRRLMFSPRKRGGVGNKSKSGKSPIKSRDIYSPTPEKKTSSKKKSSSSSSSIGGGILRGSISAAKVQGSLRKERKRRKSSAAGGSMSNSSAARASLPMPAAAQPEPEPEPELKPTAVEFAYPPPDAVAVPGPDVLQHFHQLAVSTSTSTNATVETHQTQLDSLGSQLLSLEDVLLPAAARQENAALKAHQARLQRDPSANASSIDICKSVRAYVLEMASVGATAARSNRLEREVAFQSTVADRDAAAQAERRRLRSEARQRQLERREVRAARRRQDAASRRVRDIKAHPRNKELYREMAGLLKDHNRLQREERRWEDAGQKLAVQEAEVTRRLEALAVAEAENKDGDDITAAADEEVEQSRHLAATAERSAQDAVDDVLTSAGRVESALTEVAALVQQSDGVRRELYGKYRTDHQFHGYRGNKNTKGLIVALSQG